MDNRNKGYSLLELIVVIALATILSSVAIYSISLVVGQDAKQCANNLSAALDKARTYAMTRSGASDAYMEITKRDGYYYASYWEPDKPYTVGDETVYNKLEEERIGKGMAEITYTVVMNDGTTQTFSDASSIRFTYDRTSGAFKEVESVRPSGKLVGYCQQIDIQRGKHYKLTLYSATGKHVLDRIG